VIIENRGAGGCCHPRPVGGFLEFSIAVWKQVFTRDPKRIPCEPCDFTIRAIREMFMIGVNRRNTSFLTDDLLVSLHKFPSQDGHHGIFAVGGAFPFQGFDMGGNETQQQHECGLSNAVRDSGFYEI